MVGTFRNSIDGIPEFLGEEGNVPLELTFNHIHGERGSATIYSFKEAVNDNKAQVKGGFTNASHPIQIPAGRLFGMKPCKEDDNSLVEALKLELPQEPRGRLDKSQLAAVGKLLGYRTSIGCGPPGTVKTCVLAEALACLLKKA